MTKISARIPGREEVHFEFQLKQGQIVDAKLTGTGGPDFLHVLVKWRSYLTGDLLQILLPEGQGVGEILLREVILKAQGLWNFPYKEVELCHCRAISTAVVDAAIMTGAHDPETVSQMTSASTACGTCRPDVESMIAYRLYGTPEQA